MQKRPRVFMNLYIQIYNGGWVFCRFEIRGERGGVLERRGAYFLICPERDVTSMTLHSCEDMTASRFL